jgi:hypothetical protein
MNYGSRVYPVALLCGVYLWFTRYAISHVTFTLAVFEVADSGSRPVYDVGLLLLACWNCWFEPCPRAWLCLLWNFVCCQVEVCVMDRSLVQRSPNDCVCLRMISKLTLE